MQQLGLAPGRCKRPVRGFTDDRRIVTIGDNQSRLRWQIAFLVENSRKLRRHRPKEAIAIIEIIEPLAVTEKIGLGDLDLDDRKSAFGIDRHEIGAPSVGEWHFANRE